jgi:hypothetical protein
VFYKEDYGNYKEAVPKRGQTLIIFKYVLKSCFRKDTFSDFLFLLLVIGEAFLGYYIILHFLFAPTHSSMIEYTAKRAVKVTHLLCHASVSFLACELHYICPRMQIIDLVEITLVVKHRHI